MSASLAKNSRTVPGFLLKISNHHSTITNLPLAPPACQRLPVSQCGLLPQRGVS
jgi:hypothetical protein